MALTYNSSTVASKGNTWTVMANLSPDTSYPAGGYAVNPQQLRLRSIESFIALADQYYLFYDSTTGKLRFLTAGGGGGGLTFNGTPMAGHAHLLTPSATGISPDDGLYVQAGGAPGLYTVGETITGGTSGATGTVLSSGASYIQYTPTAGTFRLGETITGGTSGLIKTCTTLPYKRFVFPSPTTLCTAVYDDDITGRQFKPSISPGNLPNIIMTTSTIVGTFVVGEVLTGGTSGATGVITYIQAGGTHIEVTLSGGTYVITETLTGGTSGATCKLDTYYQERIFYHNVYDSSVWINSNIAPGSLFALYQETNDITSVSAGTPAGTITGGGGGGGFTEVTPGTNVYAQLPNFQAIITGL